MYESKALIPARTAVLVVADIKSLIAEFDSGTSNIFDTVDAIEAALEAYRQAAQSRRDAA